MASLTSYLPVININPSKLEESPNILVKDTQAASNSLVNSVRPADATFENAIRPLADIDNKFKWKIQYIALFQPVSPLPEIREASSKAVNIVDKAYIALYQDEDLFALVDGVFRNSTAQDMDEEDRMF